MASRPEVRQTVTDEWRNEALTIHDASNCAINLAGVPFVAYVGSQDSQSEQHDIIRSNLAIHGVSPDDLPEARFLVGEGTY